MTDDDGEATNCSNGVPKGPPDREPQKGMSPYATGAGGVTFERRVAVTYLAHLLVGDGAVELGDERRVVGVAFQQAPDHPVDDLVVRAARADESDPSLVLGVAVRRAPNLVRSDESTQGLIRDFVSALLGAGPGASEYRFALVVAGPQAHADQLAVLAGLAFDQMDAPTFFNLVRTPNKFTADVRGRLDQVEGLVEQALIDLGVAVDTALVRQRTWELLSRLTVLMPRLEAPDETDWATMINSLIPVTRGGNLAGASRLRDRLVALADEYPPKAATVDLAILRRGVHTALDSTRDRNQQGWRALIHLHDQALASVHDEIAAGDGARRIHIDRSDVATPIIASAATSTAVVTHGSSGVGKSALVLGAASAAAIADPDAMQVICINLRHLPRTTLEFESLLGCPLATLLLEMSAPQRILVVDSADAVAEGMLEQLRHLAAAARAAAVGVIAVTADDQKQIVRDTLAEAFGADVVDHVVPPLTEKQIDEVVAIFGELANLANNARSRGLLRRPVVIDLFVRSGVSGVPLSDSDAMQQVWLGLVRRREQSDRGTPDAREFTMLSLADLVLSGGDPLDAIGALDPSALDGLRRDGILRTPVDDPFRIGPEFSHDEVRRYAVARLLCSNTDPTVRLLNVGAPRWALGAARLACQALLGLPDSTANPLHGRFARLQTAFDMLVEAGHGERWGDVPGEALLTLGDPTPALRDAWANLRADNDKGLRRLHRLIDQRMRDDNGLVRVTAIEPFVNLLLDDETPWRSGKHSQEILRSWLRAHVQAKTPVGHPLRVRLRNRLVAACHAADRRFEEERLAAAARRAARSPEEIEKERQSLNRYGPLLTSIGYPRGRRRHRAEIPREIAEEIVVELLALLGPDLAEDGEAILRRIAGDAPAWLAPAVEGYLTGHALAGYRRGFLAEMAEAYYIDDEEDGSGYLEDGIRDHDSRTFGVTPLAASYRGPFLPLFRADFRNSVAMLNRMLNHAAHARIRTLAGLDRGYGAPIEEQDLEPYREKLHITGTRRAYAGDGNVWLWYRGTGVGPYPCMSALMALERVCDQLIEMGVPISNLVATLLRGCENLAMVGFVVGLLVRHLDRAERLLDPYLAEPIIWHYEFSRVGSESFGLAANSDGVIGAERRTWSMRETAMYLVTVADGARAAELRSVGQQLVEKARSLLIDDSAGVTGAGDGAALEEGLAPVRAWASALDRSTYTAQRTDAGLQIQTQPAEDVLQALQPIQEDLRRSQEAARLLVRYCIEPRKRTAEDVPAEELATDLQLARDLLANPPGGAIGSRWDAPIAVAAAALSAHLLRGVALSDELLVFAVDTVLRVGDGEESPRQSEDGETYFELGADRSAARTLPLLLLPAAARLRAKADGSDGSKTCNRVVGAGTKRARAVAHETRLHLARGLDRVWHSRCAEGVPCHHQIAFNLALESMRDCAFGEWDADGGRRRTLRLDDPVEASLAEVSDDAVYVSRLDPAIRALAPAAVADICVSARARAVLDISLATQRRSLLAHKRDMDQRGTHALVSARAALTLAAHGDDAPIFHHIDAFADAPRLLGSFLRALSSAAEENPERAATARRLWPEIVVHVLRLNESGHTSFEDRYFRDMTLAALIPNAAGETSYLYRELNADPIIWWDPLAWRDEVERWLTVAAGNATCVDQLISFLSAQPLGDQVRLGLPWVATLVLAKPDRVASRSFLLSSWLIEIRAAAADAGLQPDWQRVVDALVVAGVPRLAPYSE
jgi:hypothetical protein